MLNGHNSVNTYLLKHIKYFLNRKANISSKKATPIPNQPGANLSCYKLWKTVDFGVMVHLHTMMEFVP